MRGNRLTRRLALSVGCVLVVAACSSGGSVELESSAEEPESQSTTSSASVRSSTAASIPRTTDVRSEPEGEQQLDFLSPEQLGLSGEDLDQAGQATLDLKSIRYRYVAESDIPGLLSGSIIREGWFDVEADSGEGLFLIGETALDPEARDAPIRPEMKLGELLEEVDGLRFRYRFIPDILWQRISQPGDPEEWIGFEADDFQSINGSDPRSTVDGAMFLAQFLSALLETPKVAVSDEETVWSVTFDADTVAPLAAGAGTYQRLLAAGFSGVTGLAVPGHMTVSSEGIVTGLEVDVSDWWAEGMRAVDAEQFAGLSVVVSISWSEGLANPSMPDAPCDDPELDDSDVVPVLSCIEG